MTVASTVACMAFVNKEMLISPVLHGCVPILLTGTVAVNNRMQYIASFVRNGTTDLYQI